MTLLTADVSFPSSVVKRQQELPLMCYICLSCQLPSFLSFLPFLSFTFCTLILFSLPTFSFFFLNPDSCHLFFSTNTPPPPPHGNVLRNYSEVNRAGCRNEITATGLSVLARGPSVSGKWHVTHPRLSHTQLDSSCPPGGKVKELCSSKPSTAWSLSINLLQHWSMARGQTQLPSNTQEAGMLLGKNTH